MFDIDGVGDSLRQRIETDVTAFKLVRHEGDERDETIHNMPYCDVRFFRMEPEVRAGGEYYIQGTYVVTVMAFDFTSRREAVTLRNTLVKSAMEGIKAAPRFDTDLETSTLGTAEFADAQDDETKAFVALATFLVNVFVFVDPL